MVVILLCNPVTKRHPPRQGVYSDMDRLDSPEKALRDEIARLGQELEQTHVALEDAHAEIAELTGEQDGLRRQAERLIRQHAAEMATLMTDALQQKGATGQLRAALEEASVLAEELQATNEELHSTNEVLDQRVSERTAELVRQTPNWNGSTPICTGGSRPRRRRAPRRRPNCSRCRNWRRSASLPAASHTTSTTC